jgi:hypothetical protein
MATAAAWLNGKKIMVEKANPGASLSTQILVDNFLHPSRNGWKCLKVKARVQF